MVDRRLIGIMLDQNIESHSRRKFLKTSGAASTVAIFAGCVGSSGENGGSDDGSQPVITIPDYEGGGSIINESLDPGFTPATSHDVGTAFINLYDTLVWDPGIIPESGDGEHRVAPRLATDWEVISADEFVFELREDVTFHSGNEFTSEDVKYSFERAMQLGGGVQGRFDGFVTVDGLSTPNEHTFRIELQNGWVTFPSALTEFPIVDSELLKENESDGDYGHDWLEQNEAGSGPYELSSINFGDDIRFSLFEDYWGDLPENPVQEAQGLLVEQDSTIQQMFSQNDAHVTRHNLNPETYDALDQEDYAYSVNYNALGTWTISFNTQQAPFDDVNVRRAITAAVDIPGAQELIGEGSVVAEGPVPINTPGHNDNLDLIDPEQNPELALEYLDEASYSLEEINEMGGMLFHQYRDTGPVARVPLLFEDNLNEIGMNSTIQNTTFANIIDAANNPDEALSGYGANYSADPLSPDGFTYLGHHPDLLGSSYYSSNWYSSDELTERLEAARGAENIEEAYEIYGEVQQMLVDAAPFIYVSNPSFENAIHANIEGFRSRGPNGQEQRIADWSWNQ